MLSRKRLTLCLVSALCAFGVSLFAVAAPLKPKTPAPISGDGSVFGEVIPTELQQQVTVKPSWLPLSKQLASLQDATTAQLTRAPSVPDDWLFVAAPGRSEFGLLHQMRLLLTDDQWRCQWANKELGKDHHSYRLWRETISPQERRAKMVQAAKDRLAKMLALIQAGPQAWDQMRQEDPALSNDIRQPMHQAAILLAGQLSSDQLDGVLAGTPLTLSVAGMSPQDQASVRQSISSSMSGYPNITDTDNATGRTTFVFNAQNLPTTGRVVFEAKPLANDPGSLGLAMHVYTEPGQGWGMGSNEMLYPDASEFGAEGRQIAARHRQEAANALAAKTPGTKTVTIMANIKPEDGEPQIAAYLRAFATQTGLTVLAHWPQGDEAPDKKQGRGLYKKLPASIVRRPAGEALDILCRTYGGEWVQDEATVRLRAHKPAATMDLRTNGSLTWTPASAPSQPVKKP